MYIVTIDYGDGASVKIVSDGIHSAIGSIQDALESDKATESIKIVDSDTDEPFD